MADKIDLEINIPPERRVANKILMVAGEESGDIYAGRLCAHLFKLMPGVNIEGIGGPRMRAAGAETFYDIAQMSSVGVASMLGRLGFFLRVLGEIKQKIATENYDAVILIDYPDFNMRVAKAADAAGTPVFYYVCPQFWAWRRYRLKAVKKWVDMMLVVFPFEEEFYVKRRINASFIGHPIQDELEPVENRDELHAEFCQDNVKTLVGILPGSRHGEVSRMLPDMLAAIKIIRAKKPVTVVVACAESIDTESLEKMIEQAGEQAKVVQGRTWEVMNACDYLICKSGTSTLQAALAGTPMQIVYRSDWLSYQLAKNLSYVEWAGLPNLLAGREIVPELLQGSMTPQNMAKTALPYLMDPAKRGEMKSELQKAVTPLAGKGASLKAANLIVEYLKKFKAD